VGSLLCARIEGIVFNLIAVSLYLGRAWNYLYPSASFLLSKVFNIYVQMLYWGMNVKENDYSLWHLVVEFFTGRCKFRNCHNYRGYQKSCNHAAGPFCGTYKKLDRG